MISIQLLGLFFMVILSLAIDYPELKKAKKERKVIIVYGLLMFLAFIIWLEIILKLDVLNPNRIIENTVKMIFRKE